MPQRRNLLAVRHGAILDWMTRSIPFGRATALSSGLVAILLLALIGLSGSNTARADELKLKDGTTISGTIVGFGEKSFKVKTNYGFAVVQKDQVVSISMSDAPKTASEKKSDAMESKTPAPKKPKAESASAAVQTAPVSPASKSTGPPAIAPSASAPTPAAAKNVTPHAAATAVPLTAVAAPAKVVPVRVAAPEPIREEVTGNTYTNDTYSFRMYKPPDWDVIAAERALLPGAIAAMGTNDETTYLLIGQEPAGKSLAGEMEATQRRLRDIMDNFRSLDEKQIIISGISATVHHFRGSVDEHEWSGVVVLLARGGRLYTIFGMTRADSDLVQIQENVIARTISSFQFTEQ
jgi:hypothetical protein